MQCNNFSHSIDNSKIPTVNIMGVNIAAINMDWLLDFTHKNIHKLNGDYLCASNVHTTVMAFENDDYCKVQNNAILAIPDGGPLCSIGKKRGFPDMSRTDGPGYMDNILKVSDKYAYRHFFYGSTPETLQRLLNNIEKKYPTINIVGQYSPPFRELSDEEDIHITKLINDSHPDFVWIGLGAPKQEFWMYQHQGKIEGFMVGVGAAFDFFANNKKRAPQWMQKHNLEWFYRLIQEPKRLFKRYFYTNIKFIWHAVILGK